MKSPDRVKVRQLSRRLRRVVVLVHQSLVSARKEADAAQVATKGIRWNTTEGAAASRRVALAEGKVSALEMVESILGGAAAQEKEKV